MRGQGEIPIKEHIWMVALYEKEERADELLERLNAIGVDTSESTTVRVEIEDQQRVPKFSSPSDASTLSPVTRSSITGALVGGTLTLFAGLLLYSMGWFVLTLVEGLFSHAILFVLIGAIAGAITGMILGSAKRPKLATGALPKIQQLKSEGFLVAVKMPPPLAEQAEEIARSLGAKEILL